MAELQDLLVHASCQLGLCERNEFAYILVTDVRSVALQAFSVGIGDPICFNSILR